jgi:hypothetical protein
LNFGKIEKRKKEEKVWKIEKSQSFAISCLLNLNTWRHKTIDFPKL